jgi:acyl-CoA synthetase (AMP-forming)/AMP-acid ligase II
LRSDNTEPYPIFKAKKDDLAGIFFTTGSTGMAKGAVYTHDMFRALASTVQNFFQFDEHSIDMPAFPPFALFCDAFGGTSVIPEMDPTEPGKADPEKLLNIIRDFGVNVSYGSPSIWIRVSEYCEKNNITLPTMKRLIMFGAPIPPIVLERFLKIIPNGETSTPYGATEALFVSYIDGAEVCKETAQLTKQGKGTCVGRVIPGVDLKIIKISDDVITVPQGGMDALTVPQGTVGEIIVTGDYVTREYYNMPEQTKKEKIYDGKTVWHRMGDLAYMDDKQRLWFVGRKAHRITRDGKEYYNAMAEGYFNQLEGVTRSALVGVPSPSVGKRLVMIIEPNLKNGSKIHRNKKIRDEYFRNAATKLNLPIDTFLYMKKIPVDIRHNAKIKNDVMALWAEQKLKGRLG